MESPIADQIALVIDASGGELVSVTSLPNGPMVKQAQILRLARSILDYFKAKRSLSIALMGEGMRWGHGAIELVPNLSFARLLKEITRGRPVAFIRGQHDGPFDRLLKFLQFDRGAEISSLLNGNQLLTILGAKGGNRVIAHLGRGAFGESAIQRHAEGLSSAMAALRDCSLLQTIARPVANWDQDGISVFMQSCLRGKEISCRDLSNDRFKSLLQQAAAPLVEIHKATATAAILPEQETFRKMRDDVALSEYDGGLCRGIVGVVDEVEDWIGRRRPRAVRAHGDYTLHNVLFDDDGTVCAIFDWEWTRPNACAGFDAVHLAAWAASEHFGDDLSGMLMSLATQRDVPSALTDFFETTFPSLDLAVDDVPNLAKFVWLVILFRSGVWTRPPSAQWAYQFAKPMLSAVRASQ